MSCPPAIRQELAMLREAALHSQKNQEWLGRWWHGLQVDEKRTLLALSGLDDSVEFARRPWGQLMQDQRDKVLTDCKRIARMVGAVVWA
jgi:hypothetical protein